MGNDFYSQHVEYGFWYSEFLGPFGQMKTFALGSKDRLLLTPHHSHQLFTKRPGCAGSCQAVPRLSTLAEKQGSNGGIVGGERGV